MEMSIELQLKESIDQAPISRFQLGIVALCFLLNMNDGIDVLLVSFTATEIAKEWMLSKSLVGLIFSAGLIGMTIGCFSLAPIADRMGRRKVFLWSMACITIGMLGVSLAGSYPLILVSRLVTGLGIGGILPTMATIVSEYSNNKSRDFNVGLIQGGWPLGAILTGFFCTWAVPALGWRSAYLVMGCIALLLWIAVWRIMPESIPFLCRMRPEKALLKINTQLKKMMLPPIEMTGSVPILQNIQPWKELITPEYKSSTIRLWIGIFFGFLTLYTLMSWVPTIAKESGMPFQLATYVGMALNLGAFLGVVAMGGLVTKVGSRKTLLGFMLIAFTIMVFYAQIMITYTWMMLLIFLIGFFVQGGFNAYFPTATRIYPSHIRSTGVGMAFGIGRLGAILGPFLFGFLSDTGMQVKTLFILFSLPLLVSGAAAFSIPSNNIR
jgi:benzoate transport